MDGRYEVAYPTQLLAEHLGFYTARPGWDQTLSWYPTQAVLTLGTAAVGRELASRGWRTEHADEVWEVYVRPEAQP